MGTQDYRPDRGQNDYRASPGDPASTIIKPSCTLSSTRFWRRALPASQRPSVSVRQALRPSLCIA